MVSLTKKLDTIRAHKHTKQGKRRKRLLRAKGSTPPFPIHKVPLVRATKAAPVQNASPKPVSKATTPAATTKPVATATVPRPLTTTTAPVTVPKPLTSATAPAASPRPIGRVTAPIGSPKPVVKETAPAASPKPVAKEADPKVSEDPGAAQVARIALKSLKAVQPAGAPIVEKKPGPDRSDPRSS